MKIGYGYIPDEWDIKIKRVNNKVAEFEYTETFRKPPDIPDNEFVEIIERTKLITEKVGYSVDVKRKKNVAKIKIMATKNLSEIADAVIGEFIPLSYLSKMSLGEFWSKFSVLAAFGYASVKSAREEFYEKIKEINEGKYNVGVESGVIGELKGSSEEKGGD